MKLLEYQAKALFDEASVATMPGCVIRDAAGAAQVLQEAGLSYPVVVKAQVQIGGRGKAGGIRFADNEEEVLKHAEDLLGSTLRGLPVRELLVVEKCEHETEWYLSIMLDRLSKRPLIMFSDLGGMEIEETAKTRPEHLRKITVDPMIGIQDYMARYLLSSLGLDVSYTKALHKMLQGLYRVFESHDAMLVEVNPLIVDKEGKLIALDGKVDVDDSALYRLPDVAAWRDAMPEPELVKEARSFNFLYIPVEEQGTIGVVSNGSGMLMSCIDMISREGMKVSAALDLGGGATAERISHAMRIMFSTPGIKAVLINIFGGITRCDEVAGGVKLAFENHIRNDEQFVVIRMEGTNKDLGLEILKSIQGDVVLVPGLRESIRALTERRDRL